MIWTDDPLYHARQEAREARRRVLTRERILCAVIGTLTGAALGLALGAAWGAQPAPSFIERWAPVHSIPFGRTLQEWIGPRAMPKSDKGPCVSKRLPCLA